MRRVIKTLNYGNGSAANRSLTDRGVRQGLYNSCPHQLGAGGPHVLPGQYRPAGPTLLVNRGGRSWAIDQSQVGHLFCWHAYPPLFSIQQQEVQDVHECDAIILLRSPRLLLLSHFLILPFPSSILPSSFPLFRTYRSCPP